MLWDCLNKYRKLYLEERNKYIEEREKYLIVKEKNEILMKKLIESQEILNKCNKFLEDLAKPTFSLEKVKSKE